MHFEEKDLVDAWDLMGPDSTKWLRISNEVMRAGFSPCLCDGPACKTKWNQILLDYKKLSDYFNRIGRNVPNYWDLSAAQRKEEGLPKQFPHDIFVAIHEWCHNRRQIQPPHVRDLLAPNDANYRPKEVEDEAEDDDTNDDNSEDPMDLAAAVLGGGVAEDSMDRSTPPRFPMTLSSTPRPPFQPSPALGTPFSRVRPGLPPGVIPQIISSSETSSYSLGRRAGNTGVKRKAVSGHTIITEATKSSGALVAKHIQEIAESSRAFERSKIDVQLQLFTKQMAYQCEKDRRLYENAVQANENARLSIMKQGDIVNCLSHLSTVIGKSLSRSSSPHNARHELHGHDTNTTEEALQQ